MEAAEIARRRMFAQRLWGAPEESPAEVVAWLGAMQAQEFPFARWSAAQRARGATDAAVRDAFDQGAILRTHLLRPTWHFVSPADIRWMLGVTAPRVLQASAYRYRQLGLDDDRLIARANRIIAKSVEAGHPTRTEIAASLERAGISASGTSLAHILMRAELDAVVCSGPLRGKQHTYASVDERAPHALRLDPDEALAELTRRYFVSRGPATVKDFAAWASLTLTQGRRGLEMAGPELERETVGGRTYWFGPPGRRRRTRSARVDLVQLYDETVMGYFESRDALLTQGFSKVWDDVGAQSVHGILLDGRLVGHWKRVAAGDSVTLEAAIVRDLDPAEEKALHDAVGRYARFLQVPVALNHTVRSPA